MPFPANLPQKLRALIFGDPWGAVWPPRAPVPASLQTVDGRTVALRVLRDYVCALVFYLPNAEGKAPIPFQILPENFHLEWQRDLVGSFKLPMCVVEGSRADYDAIGLVSYIEEATRDKYAPGTVLQWQAEYVETINLEIWASEEPALRSILAGIETAISPTEQMSGLRFRMPDYYNELVCFTLNRRENYGESDAAKGRRRAQVELEMRFNVVALVDALPLQPQANVDVGVDSDTNGPLDLSPTPIAPDQDATARNPPPPGTEFLVQPDAVDARRLRPGNTGPAK
jgi:hypothetical protein